MLSTVDFFAAAARAGMTRVVTWTPSGGGSEQTADVYFREPVRDVLSGEAFSSDPMISYPATQLTGLIRGETLSVAGVNYKVREDPRSELDGSRYTALLYRA